MGLRYHTPSEKIYIGLTPLDEWSDRRRVFYLTTHNTHNRHSNMPPAEFEPATPAQDRPQTHALDRAATGKLVYIRSRYSNPNADAVGEAPRFQDSRQGCQP